MRKVLTVFVALCAFLFCVSKLDAKPLTLNEISEAVCRVKVDVGGGQSAGTGTCIAEDGTSYYILTNAHVVSNANVAHLEFFRTGYKTAPIPGKIVWKDYRRQTDVDFAIIQTSKSYFGMIPPRIIPLAPQTRRLVAGDYIASMGCPGARWVSGWEGRIDLDEGARALFTPPPVGGQSGSGLIVLVKDAAGELQSRVGAVLTWSIDGDGEEGSQGGAIPTTTLYAVLNKNMYYRAVSVPINYKEASTKVPLNLVSLNDNTKEVAETIVPYVTNLTRYALGDNYRLYKVYYDNQGYANCNVPPGVKILTWDYYNSKYYVATGGCPTPSPGGGGQAPLLPNPGYGGNGPAPILPSPGQDPGQGPGNNPYGVVPPVLPGINDGGMPPTLPGPGLQPYVPPPANSPLSQLRAEYEGLMQKWALDNNKYQSAKEALEARINAAIAQIEEDKKAVSPIVEKQKETGFFGNLWASGNNIATGIGVTLLVILLGFLLKFVYGFLKKPIDSFQSYIQARVTAKYGKEAGDAVREDLESVETAIVDILGDLVSELKTKKNVASASFRGRLQDRLDAVLKRDTTPKEDELLEAINAAAKDATTPEEVALKAKKIMRDIRAKK